MSNSCKSNSPMSDNDNYQAIKKQVEPINPQSDLIPQQADNDEQLMGLWIYGRSRHTQRAYNRDISEFLCWIEKSIRNITLSDLQRYFEHLTEKNLSIGSIRRTLASIKSLFAFAHKVGYLQFDVGRVLKIPASTNQLAQRILSQEEVQKIIASVGNTRNRLIIKTLYYTGIRISELVALKWKDLQYRDEGGQMTILGKGNKTNVILVPEHLWEDLLMLRGCFLDENPVFRSRKGGHLDPVYVARLVKKLSLKKIGKPASPHWFRHSHASHALDNGCPIHLVQKQLNHSSIATTGRYLHARPTESSSKYLK